MADKSVEIDKEQEAQILQRDCVTL